MGDCSFVSCKDHPLMRAVGWPFVGGLPLAFSVVQWSSVEKRDPEGE